MEEETKAEVEAQVPSESAVHAMPITVEKRRRAELLAKTLESGDYSFTFDLGEEVTDQETRELQHILTYEAALEAAESKIHKLSEENIRLTAHLVRAEEDLNVAFRERDARVLDEAMRAQRVDVETLRHKVNEMKKNLAAVDSRADARFVAQLRARDLEAEARIAAIRAEVQPTIDELDKVRTGEQVRVEALNAALEMIWAFDKREPGCAYNSQNLIVNLRQVLSAARKAAQ